MLPKKTGSRRRDNPQSVYFDEVVMAQIIELQKEYPGIRSKSRIIESLTRYGLEVVTKSKEARADYEKRLIREI